MSEALLDERRAIQIARDDLHSRVSWAAHARVTIASDDHGYTVSFLREITAGEPMTMTRGGGIDAGVTYRISRAHAIEAITYPR